MCPEWFLPDSDIRTQYEWFENHVAPTVTGELLLTFPELTEDDDPLKRLSVVAKSHSRLLKLDDVDGVLSAMTFVPAISGKRTLAATAQRSVVRKLIRDPASSLGQLGFIARDGGKEIWRISIRMPQQAEHDSSGALDNIRNAVNEVVADSKLPFQASLTGGVVIVQKSQEILLRDLFRSFMTAFGVIAIVMVLMLRSVLGGLIAMAPNLFPTVALFGFMGLLAIPLDIGSVMSASVALGIAVDDTVHLLSRFGSASCTWAWSDSCRLRCAHTMWLGHVSDHSGLWAVPDGILVQRFCAHKPVLAIHVRIAGKRAVGRGVPVACLDGKSIGPMVVIYDWFEPGSHYFFQISRSRLDLGIYAEFQRDGNSVCFVVGDPDYPYFNSAVFVLPGNCGRHV